MANVHNCMQACEGVTGGTRVRAIIDRSCGVTKGGLTMTAAGGKIVPLFAILSVLVFTSVCRVGLAQCVSVFAEMARTAGHLNQFSAATLFCLILELAIRILTQEHHRHAWANADGVSAASSKFTRCRSSASRWWMT